jgi:hypothetical protein
MPTRFLSVALDAETWLRISETTLPIDVIAAIEKALVPRLRLLVT